MPIISNLVQEGIAQYEQGILTAVFSASRTYRYALWRTWEKNKPQVNFILLNPSTADETMDDPTVRRCVAYAKAWGYGGLCMTNLFAYRATDPKKMKAAVDPVGPENDEWLTRCAQRAAVVVAAWGAHGNHQGRDTEVLKLIGHERLHCLGVTKSGAPRHPLYLPGGLKPITYKEVCR